MSLCAQIAGEMPKLESGEPKSSAAAGDEQGLSYRRLAPELSPDQPVLVAQKNKKWPLAEAYSMMMGERDSLGQMRGMLPTGGVCRR